MLFVFFCFFYILDPVPCALAFALVGLGLCCTFCFSWFAIAYLCFTFCFSWFAIAYLCCTFCFSWFAFAYLCFHCHGNDSFCFSSIWLCDACIAWGVLLTPISFRVQCFSLHPKLWLNTLYAFACLASLGRGLL